jgi:hypothetical protein
MGEISAPFFVGRVGRYKLYFWQQNGRFITVRLNAVPSSTITHFQEHKTTVTTASGNYYTVIDRVKFTDKVYR